MGGRSRNDEGGKRTKHGLKGQRFAALRGQEIDEERKGLEWCEFEQFCARNTVRQI